MLNKLIQYYKKRRLLFSLNNGFRWLNMKYYFKDLYKYVKFYFTHNKKEVIDIINEKYELYKEYIFTATTCFDHSDRDELAEAKIYYEFSDDYRDEVKEALKVLKFKSYKEYLKIVYTIKF